MNQIEAWIGGMEARRGRLIALLAIVGSITLLSLFLAYPGDLIRDLRPNPITDRFTDAYLPLSYDPFHGQINSNSMMLRHRILCPLIAYWLHLRGRTSVLVPWFANPIICLVTYVVILKRTRASTAFATAVVMSLTLACVTSQTWPGYQDSMASLFLLLSMGASPAPISAACMGIGMFADERILAVAPLVILWHLVKKGSPADNWRREATVRAAWIGGAAAIWFIGYLAIRHASQINPAVYRKAALVSPRDNNIMIWPAWYFALRGGWILVVALVAFLFKYRSRWMFLAFVAGIAPVLMASMFVADRSRVASYAFPAMLIGVVVLFCQRPLFTNHLLAAAMIIQVATPMANIMAGNYFPVYPAPLAVPIELFGRSTHATTAPAP